jgi:hypothetical protein
MVNIKCIIRTLSYIRSKVYTEYTYLHYTIVSTCKFSLLCFTFGTNVLESLVQFSVSELVYRLLLRPFCRVIRTEGPRIVNDTVIYR